MDEGLPIHAAGPPSPPRPPPQVPQYTPPVPLTPRNSSRNFKSAHASRSAPSTPPPPRSRAKGKGKVTKRAQNARDGQESLSAFSIPRNRHSHGLSWSSTTRDSVVDNLLFSLDNLSRQTVADVSDYRHEQEKQQYLSSITSRTPHPLDLPRQRARADTASSATSSEFDGGIMDSPNDKHSPSSNGRRSNSSTHNYPPPSSLTARLKATARAHGVGRNSSEAHRQGHASGHSGKHGSDGSSMDYGPPLDVHRMNWANGHSSSVDNLQAEPGADAHPVLERGRPVPSLHSTYDAQWDADAAPEPIVAAGPRKMQNPNATGPVYVNPAPLKSKPSTLRKITTQTDLRSVGHLSPSAPISDDIRNQAADFVRTSSMRGTVNMHPAHDPGEAAPSPGIRRRDPSPPREKQGFFKRVFGGSSRAVSTPVDSSTSKQLPAEVLEQRPNAPAISRAPTSGGPAATSDAIARADDNQMATSAPYPPPTLNKKPSSFFRRRKKSTSETLHPPPPPLPISSTSNDAHLTIKAAEPSPSISSLRKVMDPYLLHETHSRTDDRVRPVTSGSHETDSIHLFHHGYSGAADGSLRPMSEQGDVGDTKFKLKKRKPEVLSLMGSSGLLSASHAANETHEASQTNMPHLNHDIPPVSPLLDSIPLGKENASPSSRPSTGDKIINSAAQSPLSPNEAMRNFSAGTGMTLDLNDAGWLNSQSFRQERQNKFERADGEGWVITRHQNTERPSSRRSERLILQPSPSGEDRVVKHYDNVLPSETPVVASVLPSLQIVEARKGSQASGMSSPTVISGLPNLNVDHSISRKSSTTDMREPALVVDEGAEYRERARKIFDGDEEDVNRGDAAAWMGERNTLSTRTLQAYMQLFEFNGMNVLAALRMLCSKLQLRGETQQFDRIITALSARWVECNPTHGFKAQDVVHTIFYSVILLNTDLHLADIPEKMSRSAYVRNTIPTIRRVVTDAAPNAFDETLKPSTSYSSRPLIPWMENVTSPSSPTFMIPEINGAEEAAAETGRTNTMSSAAKRLSIRPGMLRADSDGTVSELSSDGVSNALVSNPWNGPLRGWEVEVETVLKSFYTSIQSRPLPLQHGLSAERNLSVSNFGRSPSIMSRTSDNMSYRSKAGFTSRWPNARAKSSRQKLYPASTIGSSRTSLEDTNSIWSPNQSSKYSFSKTLTSTSLSSLSHYNTNDAFKHSIGFANALSQAIIREETSGGADHESFTMPGGLLEDDTLALEGAPWAKEGLVKHKHHLETTDRKAKERSWVDCFAVISKGKLTLFAFNTSSNKAQSTGRKGFGRSGRASSVTGTKVGGGDWMENAEELEVFILRQTIASTLPPPGYSKTRPHVWALSLPSGAVHLFQVGTPEIAQEFMTTANYWSARLSKEPLAGGVSNIEYGWSERVINPAVLDRPSSVTTPPSSLQNRRMGHMHSMSTEREARTSVQSGSIRSSLDTGFGSVKARLPGDKVQINEWQPPSQSMMASQLMEVDQLRQLTAYVSNSSEELERHNDLKNAIELTYSPRHPNHSRAMANWQRKSDYLLREIVKFQTYIDSLHTAQKSKEAFYSRKADGRLSPATKDEGAETRDSIAAIMPRGIHTSG